MHRLLTAGSTFLAQSWPFGRAELLNVELFALARGATAPPVPNKLGPLHLDVISSIEPNLVRLVRNLGGTEVVRSRCAPPNSIAVRIIGNGEHPCAVRTLADACPACFVAEAEAVRLAFAPVPHTLEAPFHGEQSRLRRAALSEPSESSEQAEVLGVRLLWAMPPFSSWSRGASLRTSAVSEPGSSGASLSAAGVARESSACTVSTAAAEEGVNATASNHAHWQSSGPLHECPMLTDFPTVVVSHFLRTLPGSA
eukprot:CAMPEP_0171119190 /NCGR_PEP_ID=MMETSP0766_2-20121228/96595_1 /TAXON_ID=439317 /ORGANISM="Gambierdiscus australes, Strain CAWD 149" /LENGTH=253 /DNA_ID=CAMNT_0011581829 /DNA_START=468 /DNA_END=1230 /DNA_ORIENTATION=+